MMKLATTHLVLCVIEQAGREGRESGFGKFAFADPSEANHAVSRDMSGTAASFAMLDGTTVQGGAVAVQERYLDAVERFVKDNPQVASSLPRTDVHEVVRQWRQVLEAFKSGDTADWADRIDWICKYRLFEALRSRAGEVLSSKLEQLDMDYHDVANGSVYDALCRRKGMRVQVSQAQARQSGTQPPTDTRAALRGKFVSAAKSHGVQYSCDWTRLSLTSPQRMELMLLDPFSSVESEQFQALMDALR